MENIDSARFEKFKKILSISQRVKIDWVAKNFNLSKNELLDNLLIWRDLSYSIFIFKYS